MRNLKEERGEFRVGCLLRDHARSFALTICILPRQLREPLGIAYLLARTSDTLADAGNIPMQRRIAILEDLEATLEAGDLSGWSPETSPREFSGREAQLIASLPSLIAALVELPAYDEVLRLWRTILKGQLFDLRRFVPNAPPLDRDELEGYCESVAGSVGRTWTVLIAETFPDLLMRSPMEMEHFGAAYGKGLQLINILRDRIADRVMGRMYVRDEELSDLLDLAGKWLSGGEKYFRALRPGRVRYATELPHALAVSTLDKIRKFPSAARVRVSRGKLYWIMASRLASLWLPRSSNPAS